MMEPYNPLREDRFGAIPTAIVQIAESMLDPKTMQHVRFNQSQMIRNIKDYCEVALREYEKTTKLKAR